MSKTCNHQAFASSVFLTLVISIGFSLNAGAAPENTGWELVWSDEFDGDALDMSRWTFDIDCWGGGNNERQCYTDKEENVSLRDGFLRITALKKRARGYAVPQMARDGHIGNPTSNRKYDKVRKSFTSGRISTRGKQAWTYGRFEARMKLPMGQGMWPAFWMLPEDWSYGGWAASGEIDIMEAINLSATCAECDVGREDRVYGTLHFGGPAPQNMHKGRNVALSAPVDGFHVYALEWTEGRMDWYVDGEHYSTLTSEDWFTAAEKGNPGVHAPFDKPFHLILNLAVGGKWPEEHNDVGHMTSSFPKHFIVDYVRVYQCKADKMTAKECRKK